MITNEVISIDYALRNIIKIFPSSLILNVNYKIESVSENVANLLHFEPTELIGRNLNDILYHVPTTIKEHFGEFAKYGFIRPKQLSVSTKNNDT